MIQGLFNKAGKPGFAVGDTVRFKGGSPSGTVIGSATPPVSEDDPHPTPMVTVVFFNTSGAPAAVTAPEAALTKATLN